MKIIECPRDAMQGLTEFIPTEKKAAYLSQLLKVGFDTIDFGSFVSPKAIPQMRDTADVLKKLELSESRSGLLAIVANLRGASEALAFEEITYLGFPLSLSETFQIRNTNKSIAEAIAEVAQMQDMCTQRGKELVVYLSMGFGNPFGDPYNEMVVAEFSQKLFENGVHIISLADTVGVSVPDQIRFLFKTLIKEFPQIEFGAHLHSTKEKSIEKIVAAFESGCQRFDGAIKGFGGCPMANDDLVGNLATETILAFLRSKGIQAGIDEYEFTNALLMAYSVFPRH
jgi:hydroxymethylglutaryl-CoA lyase